MHILVVKVEKIQNNIDAFSKQTHMYKFNAENLKFCALYFSQLQTHIKLK